MKSVLSITIQLLTMKLNEYSSKYLSQNIFYYFTTRTGQWA